MKLNQLLMPVTAMITAALLAGCATPVKYSSAEPTATIVVQTNLAPMPEHVTSFGAVTANEYLYVFGGHKGERHEYSAEHVSGAFHRLNLSNGRSWETLPGSAPGQGLPLVAHAGYIYRIGGMAARNPQETKQVLFSTNVVERFNSKHGKWERFASLPAARSSHDAVVVGDKLFVAGGWNLSGNTRDADWPKSALLIDLNKPEAGWKEIPQPFQRRALALATDGARIFCIGGMNAKNETSLEVDVYDTSTGQWSKGPELPPGKHKGFGCSAIAQNGKIYVNMFQGDLLRLSPDARSWEIVGKLQHPRIAHRIVTAGATQIIALGGEDGEEKRPDLELLTPSSKIELLNKTASVQTR